MTQPLTHRFLLLLATPRDQLYSLAKAKSPTAAAAELLLQQTARELFPQFAAETLPDPATALTRLLALDNGAAAPPDVMPADVWARLCAAVELHAASSHDSRALHPESSLLRPDPLLAPKKRSSRKHHDDSDFLSPSRLILIALLALAAGVIATVYILGRPAPTHAPTTPAPASTEAP